MTHRLVEHDEMNGKICVTVDANVRYLLNPKGDVV